MKKIKLTQGRYARIDSEDFDALNQFNWYLGSKGDAVRSAKGKTIRMHRVIMNAPRKLEVDHINGDRLDNRKNNLRLCRHEENARNVRTHKDTVSGYKGVRQYNGHVNKPWIARIFPDGQNIYLGSFPTKEEAARAYNKAALKYFGEFAKINDIERRQSEINL